jgi:uncharacterized protein YdeI (BOF family)
MLRGKEKYIVSNGTAEIRVEIDNHRMSAQRVDEKTRVKLTGSRF